MLFRNTPPNRPTRLIAALVAACFIIAFALSAGMPVSTVAVPLGILALWLVAHLIFATITSAKPPDDPYDLKKLWEEPPAVEEPEEDDLYRDLAYCHRCGAAMPEAYAVCPECGSKLGY